MSKEKDSPQPLKRLSALQGLSHDHHRGLMFAFHLRKALEKGIATQRLQDYAAWFFHYHLQPHFHVEETDLFPLIGNDHPLCREALAQHRQLEAYLKKPVGEDLLPAATLLQKHIRLEERELFEYLQEAVPEERLAKALSQHQEQPSCPAWKDPFWEEF